MSSQFQLELPKKAQKKQASTVGLVHKEGAWPTWQKQRILDLIAKAYNSYKGGLQQQVAFLHSNLELHFGRRIQVLIYETGAVEGHALFAYQGKFLEVIHEEFMYVIWKVKLIEDIPNEKEI